MKNHRTALLGLAFTCSLLSLGTATADDKGYILASATPAPAAIGVTFEIKNVTEGNGVITFKAGDKSFDGKFERKEEEAEKISILSAEKRSQELTEFTISGGMTINGRKMDKPEPTHPLLKVPISLQIEGGVWKPTLQDGSPLSKEQAERWQNNDNLNDSIKSEVGIYGETPRKAGEKWKVDAATLPTFSGLAHPSGSISCEFVEVKETEDGPAAIIKATFDVTGGIPSAKPDEHPSCHVTGEITELRSIQYRTSFSFENKGTMEMTGVMEGGISVKTSGPITSTSKTTIHKP